MKRLALVMGCLGAAVLLSQATHSSVTPTSFAQSSDTCDTLITRALQEIGTACVENGRNETCYGNVLVSATLTDDNLNFRETGDIVPVTSLEALITRPANPETGEWGVALMDLTADLPEDADGLVRMVLFGGVEVTPTVEQVVPDAPTCQFTNTNASNLNMRGGPGLTYRVVDVLNRRETIEVYGQSDDGWLRSARGWVYGPLGSLACAPNTELLLMNDPASAYIAPMQAFSMTIDDSGQCRAAPPGLLIQTPDRTVANIVINNVEIRAGSTAFITGDADTMIVANYDGDVRTLINGSATKIPVGGQIEVPVDEEGNINGRVSGLRPIQGQTRDLDPRILALLPTEVSIPRPAVFTSTSGSGPGQWLGCGSCSTCGHPANECVTAPDGACLWDPSTCNAPASDTIGISCSPACSGTYVCGPGAQLPFSLTYNGAGVGTISDHDFATAGPVQVTVLNTSPTSINFVVECLTFGTGSVSVYIDDTLGNNFSSSFTITIN